MSSPNLNLKSTIDKLKNLEAEKLSLLTEVEELRRAADAKANVLANEIAALKDEVNSLKLLMEQGKPQPPSNNYIKDKNLTSVREIAQKTLDTSNLLANQVFTTSPYTQYFDDWLINFRQVISDFETKLPNADEQFIKERSQILLNLESALDQKRLEEANLSKVAETLAENNHLLVETDREYAQKASELNSKRESEIKRLTDRVYQLEREVQNEEQDSNKRKLLKKKTEDKLPQTRQDLKSARNDLEIAQKNFALQQEKLHDTYEKKKLDLIGQVESLRKELATLETDPSIELRQTACKELANAINAVIQRTYTIT